MLLAIDPGSDSGWAVFDSCRRLASCGLYDGEKHTTKPVAEQGTRAVIETPKLRPWGEKNPNAILSLARNSGEWGGRYEHCAVEYVIPNDWKGTTPKDVSHRRILTKLSPEELRALVVGCAGLSPRLPPIDEAIRIGLTKADRRHNVLDAIGIGLWGVGR